MPEADPINLFSQRLTRPLAGEGTSRFILQQFDGPDPASAGRDQNYCWVSSAVPASAGLTADGPAGRQPIRLSADSYPDEQGDIGAKILIKIDFNLYSLALRRHKLPEYGYL